MKHLARLICMMALLAMPWLGGAAAAQEGAEILVTSSGQALDAFTVKTLLTRAGVANEYDRYAAADKLAGRKAVIIAMGASVKGFGAAGITAETEMQRTKELLDAAKAQGVTVIGVHIGGAERRKGLSEQFVELVSNGADALVVWEAGNEDGYFDKVAADRGIELRKIASLPEVSDAIAGLLPAS